MGIEALGAKRDEIAPHPNPLSTPVFLRLVQ